MGAISHETRFVRALKTFKHEKASFGELAAALGPKWTADTVEDRARRFEEDEKVPIAIVRGGVQYFGCETGQKPGLYKEVRRGIKKRWGNDNAMSNIVALHTSRTADRDRGPWSQPDLVARVIRRSDAEPPVVYLAIEVEQSKGFGVASVYQAYEFGRGADFSWVFYAGPACDEKRWGRIETAAKDLGVGIVHAGRPTQPAGWTTKPKARARSYTRAEQQDFLERSGVTVAQFDGIRRKAPSSPPAGSSSRVVS